MKRIKNFSELKEGMKCQLTWLPYNVGNRHYECTVRFIDEQDYVCVDGGYFITTANFYNWEIYSLEEKTLRDVEVGDVLVDEDGDKRKVLEVLTCTVLLSDYQIHTDVDGWYTFKELEQIGLRFEDQEPTPETFEFEGKKYLRSDLLTLIPVEEPVN